MGSFPRKGMFFQDFKKKINIYMYIYSGSVKCPLHIASYALGIEASVMELYKALNF